MPGDVAPVADEREGLLGYLDQQRYVLRITAYGLDDEQAQRYPDPERTQRRRDHQARDIRGALLDGHRHAEGRRPSVLTTVLPTITRTASVSLPATAWARSSTITRKRRQRRGHVIDQIPDLGQAVPIPKDVPWFPKDVDAWSVRWVLLHLIEETARHAGHADIIREAIDGGTGFPLMAAVEGWPEIPWMKAWEPAKDASTV